jgi:glycosyltransferase involved in cell wall biosynthesis
MTSIIIPTHNRAHLISRAIQSVIGQSYTDWELIIVDDGSTDNTEEVLQGLIENNMEAIKNIINSNFN